MDQDNDLKRSIGLGTAVILVIANMIGTGVFTTSGYIMDSLKNPASMLLCWFIGGVLALSGALCYGELGAIYPKAGGEYVFLRESIGKALRVPFRLGIIDCGFFSPHSCRINRLFKIPVQEHWR